MTAISKEMVDFLMEKCGGEEAVKEQFYHDRIVALVRSGITIGDMIKTAEKEGFGAVMEGMTIQELSKILRGSSKEVKKGGRLTKDEFNRLKDSILVFLNTNSWSKKGDIAEALGVDPSKITGVLKNLREEEKIKIDGKRAAMAYTISGDRKKRPE